jgi:hypothetical protein
MNAALERRLRQLRSRVLARSREYRQRQLARGAWFRLRRLLADAAEAYTLSPEASRELLEEGFRPQPAGAEFHPPKVILVVPRDRAARIPDARPVALRLGGDLLLADHIALVPFTVAGAGPDSERRGPIPAPTPPLSELTPSPPPASAGSPRRS